MIKDCRGKSWYGVARLAVAIAGALVLAGCTAGYGYVRTSGGGGYYTSAGPYSGYYDTDPYYGGGSGYYNGYGYYGRGYGYYGGGPYWSGGFGYGYPSGISISLGTAYGWGYPGFGYGYGWPWYAGGYPAWNCAGRGCGYWGHHHHGYGDHGDDDHAPANPGQPFVPPPKRPWGNPPPVRIESAGPASPALRGRFEGRPVPRSVTSMPPGYVRAPVHRAPAVGPGYIAAPAGVMTAPRPMAQPAFVGERAVPARGAMPRPTMSAPPSAFRVPPTRATPVVTPRRHIGNAPDTEVQ